MLYASYMKNRKPSKWPLSWMQDKSSWKENTLKEIPIDTYTTEDIELVKKETQKLLDRVSERTEAERKNLTPEQAISIWRKMSSQPIETHGITVQINEEGLTLDEIFELERRTIQKILNMRDVTEKDV